MFMQGSEKWFAWTYWTFFYVWRLPKPDMWPVHAYSIYFNIIGIKYFYLSLSIFISCHLFIFFKAKTFDADVKQKMNQAQVSEPKVGHFVLANYQRYMISEHRPTSEVRINESWGRWLAEIRVLCLLQNLNSHAAKRHKKERAI